MWVEGADGSLSFTLIKLIGELARVSFLMTFQFEFGTMRLRDLSRIVYTTEFHLALHEKLNLLMIHLIIKNIISTSSSFGVLYTKSEVQYEKSVDLSHLKIIDLRNLPIQARDIIIKDV